MKPLEALPEHVVASLEVRDRWRRALSENHAGLEFIVSDLSRWKPGATVRIAFLDGDRSLHSNIELAVGQIAEECNLVLDFGRDPATGEYRRWSESDTEHAAEIRVSFDQGGYWSLVGTDSTDVLIGGPGSPAGGGPGQRSLNLEGFAEELPSDWEGTTRHEFLHALAFHHAHQNLRGPCAEEFRWEDDPGYQPTQDERGVFVPDGQGRRPGIYTYLAGAPNRWSRSRVDFNLRTNVSDDVVVGPFDTDSVMLYAFDSFFYKSDPSPCAPTGNGIDLSDGDRRGLALLYPRTEEAVGHLARSAATARDALRNSSGEEGVGTESAYERRVRELLDRWVG
jgi:hypothetical protein